LRDALWRGAMVVSFRLYETYCYFVQPRVHGVYVAVWCQGQLLLIENSYRPRLYFPSGGVRRGERPLEAARRELNEEVGIDLPLERFTLAFEMQLHHDNMRDRVSTYEVHLDGPPRLAIDRREVVTAAFVTPNEARKLDLAAVVREYVNRRL
jgi:8-oxo-dGTP pyrophosphatase MutT (NUDIX family)